MFCSYSKDIWLLVNTYLFLIKKEISVLTKTKLKKQIEKFPEEFSIDDLINQLILIEKIEIGNKQSENGEIISELELDEEIAKWFK